MKKISEKTGWGGGLQSPLVLRGVCGGGKVLHIGHRRVAVERGFRSQRATGLWEMGRGRTREGRMVGYRFDRPGRLWLIYDKLGCVPILQGCIVTWLT